MGGHAEKVLSDGDAYERAALESVAAGLIAARPAASAPDPELPGLGQRPTPDELANVVARNRQRVWAARRQLYADGLSYKQAADALGVSDRQISNLVSSGDLLALDGPDGKRLPAWQFDPDTADVRLKGIARVAAVFPGRVLGLSAWMASPNPTLQGRTPAAALADGDVDLVVAVAERR